MLMTLAHIEPDRIPTSGDFQRELWDKLKMHFRVSTREEVSKKLGIDQPWISIHRGQHRNWKPSKELKDFYYQLEESSPEDLSDEKAWYNFMAKEYGWYEEWGVKRRLGKKYKGSDRPNYYFTYHPLQHVQLSEYEFPDNEIDRFDNFKEAVKEHKEDRLVFGIVWGPFWAHLWQLRGLNQLMMDFHTNQKFVNELLDRELEYSLEQAKIYMELDGDGVKIDDDHGTQAGLFINPSIWRKFIKPRFNRFVSSVKKRGGIVLFHCDGKIDWIIPDIVECGVDILDPVQPEVMDRFEVKRKYGTKFTISTGASVQKTLPFGTREDVKKETLDAVTNLAPGGGLVYGTSHQARLECPVENILALYETLHKHGKYPIKTK
jgi:hypothetical protein